jgi:AcrR family transcriptional regulator
VKPAGRPRLDRATVVAAAGGLLDEAGVEAFSMTRLGERLGVTAMALYRHVADRDDLEQALVEQVFSEFGALEPTGDSWQAGIAGWMRALRRCWVAHPWVGSLLASRTEISAAWLSVLDELAAILADAGLSTTVVARELEQISRTTVGILLQEVRAPLPHPGLTGAVITHLPAEAGPAGGPSKRRCSVTATTTSSRTSSAPRCCGCARCCGRCEFRRAVTRREGRKHGA